MKLSEKVYSRNFKRVNYGYDAYEVDEFLDELNMEIVKLEDNIDKLTEALDNQSKINAGLESKLTKLQLELSKAQSASFSSQSTMQGTSNMELISRISNMETKIEKIMDLLNNKS